MSSPSSSRTKKVKPHSEWSQQGAFSPFMFGLLMGVTIFSALSLQLAKQQMAAFQKKQAERAQKQAEDVASALDFAILTEDKQSYSDHYNLDRARAFANTTAKTRGSQDFLVTAREQDEEGRFGERKGKVAITASDDILLRSQVYRTESAGQLAQVTEKDNQPVAVYDTSAARERQIRTSIKNMEALAEQVYAFYAAHMKFPTTAEYEQLQGKFGLKDVWGEKFEYSVTPDQQSGNLTFTSPWEYTHTINLSLKNDI